MNKVRVIAVLLVMALVVGIFIYLRKHSEVMDKEPAVCFVVEADDLYDVDFGEYLDIIEDLVNRHGVVMEVVADGEPYVSFDFDIPVRENKLLDFRAKEEYTQDKTAEIIKNLRAGVPKDPENDLLGAISLANQQLLRCRSATERTIIVIGSGISRTGVFNFIDYSGNLSGATVTNILGYNPEKIVRKLEAANTIPDLTEINHLKWYGFGRTAGAQQISENETKALKALWDEITEFSGLPADYCELTDAEKVNLAKKRDFYIKEYQLEGMSLNVPSDLQSTVITFGSDTPVETDITGLDIHLTEQRIGFVPGQAKFISPDKASRIMEQYALDIKEWSPGNGRIYIVGLFDSDEDDEQVKAVALERAIMVKNLLISLDCSEAAFETLTMPAESDPLDSSGGESTAKTSGGQDDAVLILGSKAAEGYELG